MSRRTGAVSQLSGAVEISPLMQHEKIMSINQKMKKSFKGLAAQNDVNQKRAVVSKKHIVFPNLNSIKPDQQAKLQSYLSSNPSPLTTPGAPVGGAIFFAPNPNSSLGFSSQPSQGHKSNFSALSQHQSTIQQIFTSNQTPVQSLVPVDPYQRPRMINLHALSTTKQSTVATASTTSKGMSKKKQQQQNRMIIGNLL